MHLIQATVIKSWTDRGSQDWVTVKVKTNDGWQHMDIKPDQLLSAHARLVVEAVTSDAEIEGAPF